MNGIIVIDKPAGWTSHDVIGKLRGLFRERRIGHGGTLDPMATGVLPVFVGRATRAVPFCENAEKEYIGTLRPGVMTDTQDITGTVLETRACSVTADDMLSVIPRFLGEQRQFPPMYSAIKVGGKKLYELARKGVEVERKPRTVTISEIELVGESSGDFILRIVCSKGTYIRTLFADIGEALGCGACLSSLRRTRAGRFTLNDAVTVEEVALAAGSGTAESLLMPVDRLFSDFPAVTLSQENMKKCLNGTEFPFESDVRGLCRVYDPCGSFLMLGQLEESVMKTVKSFFEVSNG